MCVCFGFVVFGRVDFVGALTFTYFPSPSHFFAYELHTNASTHHQLECFQCEFIDSIENEWRKQCHQTHANHFYSTWVSYFIQLWSWLTREGENISFQFRKKKVTIYVICVTYSLIACARIGRNKNISL